MAGQEPPAGRVDVDRRAPSTAPGSSGSGSVSECRRVPLSIPLATRCEAPSGSTSDRLTATPMTRAVDATWRIGPRATEDRQRRVERRRRVDQRARLVRPLVARQPERHAARPQAAVIPTVGS